MTSTAAAAAAAAATAPPPQEQPTPTTLQKPLPKPYWSWWNPNLPWLDSFICKIASWFIPLWKVAKYPPKSIEAQEINRTTRIKFDKSITMGFHQYCRKWSKACGGLVECTWKVPRRAEILHEWKIIDKDDALLKDVMEKETANEEKFVTVHAWCPASLVLKEGDDSQENDYGCVKVDSVNLKDIPADVPVVLWFHGGGLTLGKDDGGWGPKITAIVEKQKEVSGSDTVPPMVLISVDYRLAPDHPLPAASIDALSALDYCLKDDTSRTIHVGGESAGAYLALQCAFAGHKQYPGRIPSTLAMIPFISPAADSMSYYMNSYASPLVTNSWLRWCWRAAFEMDDIVVDDSEEDVIAVGSNRTAWNQSKWKQNEQWHKFLEPMEGIPPGLDDKKSRYIISVNKADALYDEGNELMRRLNEKGADVDYVEAMGTHAIGFEVDRKAMAELIDVLRAAIFDE